MRTRLFHTLSMLALFVVALGLGAITLTECAAGSVDTPQSTIGAGPSVHPVQNDARFTELMAEWKVAVPAAVDVHGYEFIFGPEGRLRRATLTSSGATAEDGSAWVETVASQWDVAPMREVGNEFWAAWSPGGAGVRVPVGDGTVQFIYIPSSPSPAYSPPLAWELPEPPDLGFTDARATYSDTSDRYEFIAPTGTSVEPLLTYMTVLAAEGWELTNEQHATRDGARFEWASDADGVTLTFHQNVRSE
jgi:hypothetical protein